jgi:TolA-binding protein
MTENQFEQMMKMMTNCVNGVQRLESNVSELKSDVSELKSDVSELKAGQLRVEKALETNNKALDMLAGDSIRVKARVDVLERDFTN